MFLLSANAFPSEYNAFKSDIRKGMEAVVEGAERDLDFLRLVSEPFAALPSKSIDHAIIIHTSNAAVLPADIGWSYVSFWVSLRGIGDKDANGNVIKGDALAIDTKSSFVSSDERW